MIDTTISKIVDAFFTKTSLLVHTLWFAIWFKLHLDTGLLTNIVSLEAIYLAVFIGYTQKKHVKHNKHQHELLSKVLKAYTKDVKVKTK